MSEFLPEARGFSVAAMLLLAALLIEAALPDPTVFYGRVLHPVALVGRACAWAERRLNQGELAGSVRRARGMALLGTFALAVIGLGIAVRSAALSLPQGWLLELACIVPLLAQRSLYSHVLQVARALERSAIAAARAAVAHIVGRRVEALDTAGVARAAIESAAENFSDAVLAPAFWYLAAGLPGLFLYKTVSTLDSMIGYRNERFIDFGRAAARFDDAMNLVPARIAGIMLVAAAALMPGANATHAWRVMRADAQKHASPNAGWPEAAVAGALGLMLGGPRDHDGAKSQPAWLGKGRSEAREADIRRALGLYAIACALQALVIAGIAVALA